MVWWIVISVACLTWCLLRGALQSRGDVMPQDFDFDAYKTREINQRGVYDKTKWWC